MGDSVLRPYRERTKGRTRFLRVLTSQPVLIALLFLLLFGMTPFVYQRGLAFVLSIGNRSAARWVSGMYAPEQGEGGISFRWTTGQAQIRLPRTGFPYQVELWLAGPNPEQAGPAQVRLTLDGRPGPTILVGPTIQSYRFAIDSWAPAGDAVLMLDTNTFTPTYDQRPLGVACSEARIWSPRRDRGMVLPPLDQVLSLAGIPLLVFVGSPAWRKVRAPWRFAVALAVGLALEALLWGKSQLLLPHLSSLLVLLAVGAIFCLTTTAIERDSLAGASLLLAAMLALIFYSLLPASYVAWMAVAGAVYIWWARRLRSDRWNLLSLAYLATPAISPLLISRFPRTDDTANHLLWLNQLDRLIQQGVLYPRWAPDLVLGHGTPAFNFYAPAPRYLMEAFHLLGFTYVNAINLAFAIALLLSILGMYLYARHFFGQGAALLCSVAYLYFPYHLADVYVRGTPGETMALALLPWILWALEKLLRGPNLRRMVLLACLLALLLVTHNVLALLTVPFVLLYGFCSPWVNGDRERRDGAERRASTRRGWWLSLGAILLSLGLSAGFLLPAFVERRLIWGGQIAPENTPLGFHREFLKPDFLFRTHPGQVYAPVWFHHPGQIQLLLAVAGAVLGILSARRARKGYARVAFFASVGGLALLLQLRFTYALWKNLPLLGSIQFPWRLLAFLGLATAALTGYIALFAEQNVWGAYGRLGVITASALVLLGSCILPLQPRYAEWITTGELSQTALMRSLDGSRGQFFPIWVDRENQAQHGFWIYDEENFRARYADRSPHSDPPTAQIRVEREQGLSAVYRVDAQQGARVVLPPFYFPGWRALVSGREAKVWPDPASGQIALEVPAGQHVVEIYFSSTPLRRVAVMISGGSLLVGVVLAVLRRKTP